MATIDWPALPCFRPRSVDWWVQSPKARFQAFYTGQEQSLSHLADRLRCTIELPPCSPAEGALREAWVQDLVSAGHTVRLGHLVRPEPLGSLRGLPTVAAPAAAGARTVQVQTTPGATLLGGDVLGVAQQLLLVAFAGAVANGTGLAVVPLQRPLLNPLVAGAAVAWQAPVGLWQLQVQQLAMGYGRAAWQRALAIPLREVT